MTDEATASAADGFTVPSRPHPVVTYPEWVDPYPGSPIRQGDVLVASGLDSSSAPDIWHQALVVITADCDLANTKHAGSLSCVPILPLTDYLLHFRIDKLRDRVVARHIKLALKAVSEISSPQPGPQVSAARMREWVEEESVDNILEALVASATPGLADNLRGAHDLATWNPSTVREAAALLAKSRVTLGDFKSEEKAAVAISAELAGTLKDLPGDALYLNEISAQHSIGFVAYLRRIVEIADHEVATTQFRLNPEIRYVRASRLRAPYIYALTQQFAAVFSAIGLPTAYEDGRELAADAIRNGEL